MINSNVNMSCLRARTTACSTVAERPGPTYTDSISLRGGFGMSPACWPRAAYVRAQVSSQLRTPFLALVPGINCG